MSEHKATLSWTRKTTDFAYETYERTHEITFEGGQKATGSAGVEFMGKREFVNPEETLAASLAGCHMLTFLAICARSRLTLDSYTDEAVAVLEKDANGIMMVTKIHLHPKTKFSGDNAPDAAKLKELHDKAHKHCFIGNSIKCEVVTHL